MGAGSGISSQLGIAPESTYGTYVAPTKFLRVDKESLQDKPTWAQGKGAGAGLLLPLATRRVRTVVQGEGSLELDVTSNGMGLLLQTLMGSSSSAQQASSTAYLQTHTLGDPQGKSLTIQKGVPQTDGTVKAFSFLGCKVAGASFTYEVDKTLSASVDIDARELDEQQTLAVASYTNAARPFVGTDTGIKVGDYGAEGAVTGVTKATVKIERPMKTDRQYFGQNGRKAEPIINDFAKITGTISADFVDKADWHDRFEADDLFSLVLEAVGPVAIESTYFPTFRITLPGCYLTGSTPTNEGLDVVNGDFPFECLYDGTNYPKIEYLTSDTAI